MPSPPVALVSPGKGRTKANRASWFKSSALPLLREKPIFPFPGQPRSLASSQGCDARSLQRLLTKPFLVLVGDPISLQCSILWFRGFWESELEEGTSLDFLTSDYVKKWPQRINKRNFECPPWALRCLSLRHSVDSSPQLCEVVTWGYFFHFIPKQAQKWSRQPET